jgi:hypothetical protein
MRRFYLLLLTLSLLTITAPTEAALPKIKIAVVEGYGSDRQTFSYIVKGDSLTKKKKISDETQGLQQFTKGHLVYYDVL